MTQKDQPNSVIYNLSIVGCQLSIFNLSLQHFIDFTA
jgi:hypothetical protein